MKKFQTYQGKDLMLYSGRDLMDFPPLKDRLFRFLFGLADWFGFWKFPPAVDYDVLSDYVLLVWFYTSGRPIIRAERGSGLEAFFARQRQDASPALPAGFQTQAVTTLTAVGDLMCSGALDHAGQDYYRNVADLIFTADISFANLESTLTAGEIEKPIQRVDENPKINATPQQYETVSGYQGRKYSIFQLANNHILDNGLEGVLTTCQRLDADGIPYIGINHQPDEQNQGRIFEMHGLRLGFVAATYSLNLRPYPAGKEHLVNMIRFHQLNVDVDLSLLERQIQWCRAQGCDLVIAGLHWGMEWEFFPRTYQLKMAHQLAESGADIIIGHHAHVIQPMEWYQTKRDPQRFVPILYNLGNLVPICSAPFTSLSLVSQMELVTGELEGQKKTFVQSVKLTPVIQLVQNAGDDFTVSLEKLQSLVAHPPTQAVKEYADEAAKYADLVLGQGWRQTKG